MKPAIFDSVGSRDLSLDKLIKIYTSLGVDRIIFKYLSPNDNSKNQPYIAGDLSDIGFIPTGELTESQSLSNKTKDPKRKIKYIASMIFYWISSDGTTHPAPDAKIIYYPQYPEVRLSGFLNRCDIDSGGWMAPDKKGREPGRVMLWGIKESGEIYAYLAVPGTRIAREIHDYPSIELTSIIHELKPDYEIIPDNPKDILILELKRIYLEEWVSGKRLYSDGHIEAYTAPNGGGYTMEAELGIRPNGIAEPDFMGWEIKQFGVKKCHLIDSKSLTVMTPEPDGGFYKEQGAEAFVRRFGYSIKEKPGRYDFTGRHFANNVCERSGMTLQTIGFDSESGTITDASGSIALLDENGNPASLWTFAKIMGHWKRKHAKAAYIPSLSTAANGEDRLYHYCSNIRLFTGTSFTKLLKAIDDQHVYYDPGINIKNADTKPVTKRRSQFRIKSSELISLYDSQEDVDVTKK